MQARTPIRPDPRVALHARPLAPWPGFGNYKPQMGNGPTPTIPQIAVMRAIDALRNRQTPIVQRSPLGIPDATYDATPGAGTVQVPVVGGGNRQIDAWGRDVTKNRAATRYAPGIKPRAPGNAVSGRQRALQRLAHR